MRTTILISIALIATACGGGGSRSVTNPPPVQDAPVGDLRVATATELEASIKAGMTRVQDNSALESADTLQSAPVSSSLTGTYTQEANVDEFDSVRYNGSHLFIAENSFSFCCVIALDAAGVANEPPTNASIRILSTDPAVPDAQEVGSIELPDGISVQGMYTYESWLVVLTSEFFYGGYGAPWADIALWAPTTSGVRVYDITDASSPSLTYAANFDGLFVESRRVGNHVYIVSRYTPHIDDIILPVRDEADANANEEVLDRTPLDALLPQKHIDGTSTPLVAPDRCYVLTDGSVGYPVITSIVAIPIDDPNNHASTCYNEEAYGVYVAETAMYLTQPDYDTESERTFTKIHKFRFAGGNTSYAGSAEIAGFVWRGGQADFRMSEHDGVLRVISTEWQGDLEDRIDHRLYTLDENPLLPELRILGQLPNAARPEEIGKPNEALYGVRFLGERAYVVTFEIIDPLYVIDLADPRDPVIAGELEVTGFSDFLHPVSEDLLLGLGTAETGGIKLELFDVADISAPVSRGQAILGGRGSYSEATYNRHAFTYLQHASGVDRLTIPAHLTHDDDSWQLAETGLYLYEIRDKDQPVNASIHRVGEIITTAPPEDPWSVWINRSRSYLHDDAIFYVRDTEVWVAPWLDGTVADGPR